MKTLIVGHAEPAAALTSALAECGLQAELHAASGPASHRNVAALASSMVELERRMIDEGTALGVAVGFGDAPLALALNAAKLGVPLVVWVEPDHPQAQEVDRTEARIMAQLAGLDASPAGSNERRTPRIERVPPEAVSQGVQVLATAERIRDWAERGFGS